MSTIPGYDLEDYLMWLLDIKVEGYSDANASLQIADALGTSTRKRPTLPQEKFVRIVNLFEPYRNDTEYWLSEFDEEWQSWRDYSGFSDNRFPEKVLENAKEIIKE